MPLTQIFGTAVHFNKFYSIRPELETDIDHSVHLCLDKVPDIKDLYSCIFNIIRLGTKQKKTY